LEAINPILDAFHYLYGLAPAQYVAELTAKEPCCLKGALDIPLWVGFTYVVGFVAIPAMK
jgi:hypothetical protein